MIEVKDLPHREIRWADSARIVSSRFPPTGPFDRVARPGDLASVFAIESITNARLREAWGELHLVAAEDRLVGPGTTPIMAAFTHPSPAGSRFATSAFGVYYAAYKLDTAVRETVFQRERFLRHSASPPEELDMRVYYAPIRGRMCDLRGLGEQMPWLYDPLPAHYPRTQALAAAARAIGENGFAYDSVRDPGGECIAAFRPVVIRPCTQGEHLVYVWNGESIVQVYRKAPYR